MLPTASRLEFRRWGRSDSDLSAQLWSDPLVMRFLGGAYDAAKLAARLELEIANGTAYGVQYWPLFLKDGGEFAGCCGLKPFEPENAFFEIGFHLRPSFWGAGYAREAAAAVIAFAFDTLGYAALFAGHHPENEPSARPLTATAPGCCRSPCGRRRLSARRARRDGAQSAMRDVR
jgi:RimJ/RimL family protein N-acetyltransferase